MIDLVYSLRALSPVHCGVGQGLKDIDLPTARNVVSGHPMIPSSSLKGVLKQEFLGKGSENDEWTLKVKSLFGSEADESKDYASAISIGDAHLLALPVRSYFGTFAYLASPHTLNLLKTLHQRSGGAEELPEVPESPTGQVGLTALTLLHHQGKVLLEEFDLEVHEESQPVVDAWAEVIANRFFEDAVGQRLFKQRFAIVEDDVFNFICESGLPVDAHIAIDQETGTVKTGALWYEETVPAETLFAGVVGVDRSYHSDFKVDARTMCDLLTASNPIHCQVGGKSTTGKGFVKIQFPTVEAES